MEKLVVRAKKILLQWREMQRRANRLNLFISKTSRRRMILWGRAGYPANVWVGRITQMLARRRNVFAVATCHNETQYTRVINRY